jgi:anti-sigma B factor antagonist
VVDVRKETMSPAAHLPVEGELDIATAPALGAAIDRAVDAGVVALTVDLTGVRFMDSSGLRTILVGHLDLQRRGGRLRVICPEGPVRRVFRLCGVDTMIELVDAPTVVPDDR